MQTKLSVALAATLAGFALSAQAANVEVYGLIDTGLNYQHVDADRAGVDDVSKFQMKSSQSTPNRVGLRGTEDLGQGLDHLEARLALSVLILGNGHFIQSSAVGHLLLGPAAL